MVPVHTAVRRYVDLVDQGRLGSVPTKLLGLASGVAAIVHHNELMYCCRHYLRRTGGSRGSARRRGMRDTPSAAASTPCPSATAVGASVHSLAGHGHGPLRRHQQALFNQLHRLYLAVVTSLGQRRRPD